MVGFFTYLMILSVILGIAGMIADAAERRMELKSVRRPKTVKAVRRKGAKMRAIRYDVMYARPVANGRIKKCA